MSGLWPGIEALGQKWLEEEEGRILNTYGNYGTRQLCQPWLDGAMYHGWFSFLL